MALDKDDQRLVDAGLLTVREALRLPQWAKRKIIRLIQERDAARTALEQSQGTHVANSPFWLDGGVDFDDKINVGNQYSHVEVKLPGSKLMYDVAVYVERVGGKPTVRIMCGGPAQLEFSASNVFTIRPS